MTPIESLPRVLVVGAGVFGLSCAEELVRTLYAGRAHLIIVVDRSSAPPAIDAASSDLNKIVRSDYSDAMYAGLAKRAIAAWKEPLWSDHYFQSGLVVTSERAHSQAKYVADALALNPDAYSLPTPSSIKEQLGDVTTGVFATDVAYFNGGSGWTACRAAMDAMCARVRAAGVTFKTGTVSTLLYEGEGPARKVVGAKVGDEIVKADLTIVAAGAWTSTLLPEFAEDLIATGQVVATIQLDPAEAREMSKAPVVLCMDTGFYCFPPNADGVMKFAIHGPGFINPTPHLPSVPRTILTPGAEADQIPRVAALELKAGLRRIYPALADRQWASTRLCWYTETRSSNWMIDYVSPSLFVASGGSGHAFKFAPILGQLIVDSLRGKLPAEQAHAFSYASFKSGSGGDPSRGRNTERRLLKVEDMLDRAQL